MFIKWQQITIISDRIQFIEVHDSISVGKNIKYGKMVFNDVLDEKGQFFPELFVIFGVLILVLFGLSGLKSLWHVCREKYVKNRGDDTTLRQSAKRRVKAIDTVRG